MTGYCQIGIFIEVHISELKLTADAFCTRTMSLSLVALYLASTVFPKAFLVGRM